MLLRLGATPIRNGDDILEALNIGKLDFGSLSNSKNNSGNSNKKETRYEDCSERELLIIKLLAEPLERNEILRLAQTNHQIPISEVQTLLSLLELKGLIVETLGEIRLS